eukprot:UC4_evm3s344
MGKQQKRKMTASKKKKSKQKHVDQNNSDCRGQFFSFSTQDCSDFGNSHEILILLRKALLISGEKNRSGKPEREPLILKARLLLDTVSHLHCEGSLFGEKLCSVKASIEKIKEIITKKMCNLSMGNFDHFSIRNTTGDFRSPIHSAIHTRLAENLSEKIGIVYESPLDSSTYNSFDNLKQHFDDYILMRIKESLKGELKEIAGRRPGLDYIAELDYASLKKFSFMDFDVPKNIRESTPRDFYSTQGRTSFMECISWFIAMNPDEKLHPPRDCNFEKNFPDCSRIFVGENLAKFSFGPPTDPKGFEEDLLSILELENSRDEIQERWFELNERLCIHHFQFKMAQQHLYIPELLRLYIRNKENGVEYPLEKTLEEINDYGNFNKIINEIRLWSDTAKNAISKETANTLNDCNSYRSRVDGIGEKIDAARKKDEELRGKYQPKRKGKESTKKIQQENENSISTTDKLKRESLIFRQHLGIISTMSAREPIIQVCNQLFLGLNSLFQMSQNMLFKVVDSGAFEKPPKDWSNPSTNECEAVASLRKIVESDVIQKYYMFRVNEVLYHAKIIKQKLKERKKLCNILIQKSIRDPILQVTKMLFRESLVQQLESKQEIQAVLDPQPKVKAVKDSRDDSSERNVITSGTQIINDESLNGMVEGSIDQYTSHRIKVPMDTPNESDRSDSITEDRTKSDTEVKFTMDEIDRDIGAGLAEMAMLTIDDADFDIVDFDKNQTQKNVTHKNQIPELNFIPTVVERNSPRDDIFVKTTTAASSTLPKDLDKICSSNSSMPLGSNFQNSSRQKERERAHIKDLNRDDSLDFTSDLDLKNVDDLQIAVKRAQSIISKLVGFVKGSLTRHEEALAQLQDY